MDQNKEQVSVQRVYGDLSLALRSCLGRIGGIESVVRKGDQVFIKPNCLAALDASTGATTSPVLVGLIAQQCLKAGAREVVVGESSNWGVDTMSAFAACGFPEAANTYGFRLIDLKKETYIPVTVDGYVLKTVRIPKAIAQADVVINVPVLKTHDMTMVTIGIKNTSVGISLDDDKQQCLHHIGIFQALPPEMSQRGSFLEYSMVDINCAFHCNLTIVDALVAQQGMGAPLSGNPVGANLLIAGKHRASVDAVGAQIIGYNPREIPHLVFAHEKGLGEIDLAHIETFGFDPVANSLHFKPSYIPDIEDIDDRIQVVYGKGCNACRATVNYAIIRHREQLKNIPIPVTIFIGRVPHYKPDNTKRLYLHYGNCAGQSLYGGCFVPGCPPRSRRQFLQAIGAMDIYDPDENYILNR